MARRRQTQFELQREASERKAEIAQKRSERKKRRKEIAVKAASREIPNPLSCRLVKCVVGHR